MISCSQIQPNIFQLSRVFALKVKVFPFNNSIILFLLFIKFLLASSFFFSSFLIFSSSILSNFFTNHFGIRKFLA